MLVAGVMFLQSRPCDGLRAFTIQKRHLPMHQILRVTGEKILRENAVVDYEDAILHGCQRREGDPGVFRDTTMQRAPAPDVLESNEAHVPPNDDALP